METIRPTFFVTSNCHDRAPIFRNAARAELFIETLYGYRQKKIFALHEFVVMHDHVHLILTPSHLHSLERVMQFIKGGYSAVLGKGLKVRLEVWQRSFTHENLKDRQHYGNAKRYVHENPVKKGYCQEAWLFPSSSANPRFELDPAPSHLRG